MNNSYILSVRDLSGLKEACVYTCVHPKKSAERLLRDYETAKYNSATLYPVSRTLSDVTKTLEAMGWSLRLEHPIEVTL